MTLHGRDRRRPCTCGRPWATAVLTVVAAALGPLVGPRDGGILTAQVVERDSSAVTTLAGTVRSRFQRRLSLLPFAVVEAEGPRGRYSVIADSAGRYLIRLPGSGPVRLVATHTGHAPVTLTVRLPSSGVVTLDLELQATPLALDGVEVATTASDPDQSTRIENIDRRDPNLELRLLELSPALGEVGIAQAVQSLPGNDPANPTDVLFMRGSTTELKLVLLDGVPVFTPFHVAGLLRSFEPATLGSARLHVGGAPARYDGGLTHVLDLRTRSARRDRVRASASVDLLSTSVAAEVPMGTHAGMVASARTLHDLGQGALGGERPYGYSDLLVAVEGDLAPGQAVRATGFVNSESIRLDFPAARSDAAWSNRAASVGYSGALGKAQLDVTAGLSEYGANLPLQPSATQDDPEPGALLASAESTRGRAVAEATWGPPRAPFRTGLSWESLASSFAAEELRGGSKSEAAGTGTVVGAFVDATRPLGDGLTVRAGLRADAFLGTALRLSPRLSLLWEVGPEALLTVAAGRYHQMTRSPESEIDGTLEHFANQLVDGEGLLPVATADHVVLSLEQRLGRSVMLGLEGFWKRYEGLGVVGNESIRNSGVDVRVLSGGSGTTIWLGYGLSWFWSPVDLSGRATEFTGRQLLTAGASGEIGGPLRAEARLSYGAGLPSTSISFGAAADAAAPDFETSTTSDEPAPSDFLLDESFLRIDLEVHAVFEPVWAGHSWRVRPYLRLLNALDRRDALFYTYQPWRSNAVTPLAQRPILPVLGISFSF